MTPPSPRPNSSTPPSLPASHPLIAELTSLRQQLAQYQRAAHTAGIQLQGARLEGALATEEAGRLADENEGLRKEVEVLRNNPAPPPIPPTSTALTELSLAHRRLSAKLDLTESALSATQLELAETKHELERVNKEREGDRAVINEFRRVEEDREEEIEWERGERKKVEEQKKLCDLALQEYSTLVHSLDPTAVPPPTPSRYTTSLFRPASSTALATAVDDEKGPITPELKTDSVTELSAQSPGLLSPSESISNLLVGQRGVHQLFEDFSSTIAGKERALHSLEAKIEELQHSLEVVREQLQTETNLRVQAQSDREKVLRDDASAARVVERYMTFTQKTHATIHMHLENLRKRSHATQTTLRAELTSLRKGLIVERERGEKLRSALDEMSEGLNREAAGRRREVALRLKMIAADEKRGRKVESWLDHVRRAREGADGAVLEADTLESLVDEGIEAVSDEVKEDVGKEKQTSWRGLGLLKRKNNAKSASNASGSGGGSGNTKGGAEDESLARILLAEELVMTLVQDLQVEMERRTELEKQRVEWLAKEAAEGVQVRLDQEEEEGDGHVFFDLDDHEHEHEHEGTMKEGHENGPEDVSNGFKVTPSEEIDGNFTIGDGDEDDEPLSVSTQPLTPESLSHIEVGPRGQAEPDAAAGPQPPQPSSSPLITQLSDLFQPLLTRYSPLQKSLHDLSLSLSSLRTSLPSFEAATPHSPTSNSKTKKSFLPLRQTQSHAPSSDPTLIALLDGLHEVIEDARVDVEIALADHERVYRGFEALLNVGGGSGGKKDVVMRDAREYAGEKDENKDEGWKKLERRVREIQDDLVELKRAVYESEGMGPGPDVISPTDTDEKDKEGQTPTEAKKSDRWSNLSLKTISVSQAQGQGQGHTRPSPLSSPFTSPLLNQYNTPSFPFTSSATQSPSSTSPDLDPRRRTASMLTSSVRSVGSVGRSFSAGIVGAPRRVGGLAMGVYSGTKGKLGHADNADHGRGQVRGGSEGQGDEVESFLRPRRVEVDDEVE